MPTQLAVNELDDVIDVVRSVDLTDFDESQLKSVLRTARRVQASLDALICQIGVKANRLADTGQSAPAIDLFASGDRVRSSTAKRDAARSQAVQTVHGLAEAASSGTIGGDHLDIFARRITKLTTEERAKIDDNTLVGQAKRLGPKRFDQAVKRAIDTIRQDDGLTETNQKRAASTFTHWFDHTTGMGRFTGSLDPERYEALTTTIDQHVATLANANDTTSETTHKDSNLAAAALIELVCTTDKRTPNLPHITVVIDHETATQGTHNNTIRQTGNGHELPLQAVERMMCDAVLQRVVVDNHNVPINVGRKHRTATSAQWTAIRAIYNTCAWNNCDRPLSWCQLHHITEWRHGGATDLNNLVPLCTHHHHQVHEGQWSVKLKSTSNATPDRTLEMYKPDGTLHATAHPTRIPPQAQTTHTGEQIMTPFTADRKLSTRAQPPGKHPPTGQCPN